MNKNVLIKQRGQALITLLFFIVIAVTITSAAVVIILTSTNSTTKFAEGMRSYYVAESGIENALLRLLRDPSYSGETLPVSDGTATITVTGANPYTVTSVGTVGEFMRTIVVSAKYEDNELKIDSWKEQ